MSQKKFVIVGGGLSGLSSAFFAKTLFPSCHITLIEQSKRVGGMIVTNNVDKFICEEGPRSIRIGKYNRPLFYMIDKIGLYPELIPSLQQPFSYIYWNNKLRAVPLKMNFNTLKQFIQDNGSNEVFEILKAYPKMLFQSSKTDNLGEYLEEKLGKELTEKYIESVYFGIYGESIYNLSKELCFSKIHMNNYNKAKIEKELDLSKEYQQVSNKILANTNSFRFVYGVESLPKQINKYLQTQDNYQIHLNTKAKSINFEQKIIYTENKEAQEERQIQYDHLILTTPTFQTSQILYNSNLEYLSNQFKQIKCNSLFTRNICYEQEVLPTNFKGFGYLINPKQEQNILGMVADSLSFPQQYPNKSTVLSVMSLYDVNDSVILKELNTHFGVKLPTPKHIIEKQWSKAFTQFAPGHFQKIQSIQKELAAKDITIGANNYTLAIPELVSLSYANMKQLI